MFKFDFNTFISPSGYIMLHVGEQAYLANKSFSFPKTFCATYTVFGSLEVD